MEATILLAFCILVGASIVLASDGSRNWVLKDTKTLKEQPQVLTHQNGNRGMSARNYHGDSNQHPASMIMITYTVVNEITEDAFDETISLSGRPFDVFITYMKAAASENEVFQFTSVEYDFGRFITSINGVEGTSSEYWAFLLRDDNGEECSLSKGVTCTTPTQGQHYVFRFVNLDASFKPCP